MGRFLINITAFLLLCIFSIISYNLIVDPYTVIKKQYENAHSDPNQHYLKVDHIIRHPDKYDSFLFGTSKVGNIPTFELGENWYNMSYTLGLPSEFLADIQMFLKYDVKIKHLVIGLDEYSFSCPPSRNLKDYITKPYYKNLWIEYLFTPPSLKILILRFFGGRTYEYDIANTGVVFNRPMDEVIEQDSASHLRKFSTSRKLIVKKFPYLEEYLSALEKIKSICEENDIKLTIFLNPIYFEKRNNIAGPQYERFLYDVGEIFCYYDFSEVNSLNSNPYYFYERMHYRKNYGQVILDVLFKRDGYEKWEPYYQYICL